MVATFPKTITEAQETDQYYQYLRKLLETCSLPAGRPTFKNPEYIRKVQLIEEAVTRSNGNKRAIENTFRSLKILLPVPTPQKTLEVEITRSETLAPPLHTSVTFLPDASRGACYWYDNYTAFSEKWSPRGYKDFHPAVGAWLLSAVAGRRVWCPFGPKGEYTPLFIALVAHTTQHTKSTTAGIAKEVLRQSGLIWRLCPDIITPQKLLSNMAGRLPKNYEELGDTDKEIAHLRYSMSGQGVWYYDEFGQHLDAMTAKNGIMADFKGILRRFDDCEDEASSDTISRDLERIDKPYMALLASLTPADIQPYAGKDAKFWRDGFFARFAFITPPKDDRRRDRFPEGEMHIPSELITPLVEWHEHLGVPEIEVIPQRNKKNEIIGYQIIRGQLPREICRLGDGVVNAYYRYDDALADLVLDHNLYLLSGNYGRMAKKALRLAMLFASLENRGVIELRHWARAQEIAERWRASLHELYDQVATPGISESDELETNIVNFLATKQQAMTVREMKMYCRSLKHVSSKTMTEALDYLVRDDLVERQQKGRAVNYKGKGKQS